jgi:hypothetical protein
LAAPPTPVPPPSQLTPCQPKLIPNQGPTHQAARPSAPTIVLLESALELAHLASDARLQCVGVRLHTSSAHGSQQARSSTQAGCCPRACHPRALWFVTPQHSMCLPLPLLSRPAVDSASWARLEIPLTTQLEAPSINNLTLRCQLPGQQTGTWRALRRGAQQLLRRLNHRAL